MNAIVQTSSFIEVSESLRRTKREQFDTTLFVYKIKMGLTWQRLRFNAFLSLALISFCVLTKTSNAQEAQQPWYENLPAVAMDYKVHIDAGKEDCYHQYVQAGATFYVSFSVVRGGDGMAGFAVRNPAGDVVKPYQWQATSDYTDQVSPGGYYSVCIDNQFSRFASKLVNIYITVVKYDAWDKYAKEIEELQLNMQNFTATIGTVERNINDMLGYQAHSRHRESRDFALLQDNNSYIQLFSLSQIAIILITCSTQVYFVRKLFEVKTSSKGRI